MFDYRHYIPILKGKEGEFKALAHLPDSAKNRITPFIDIPRGVLDMHTNRPKDPIDTYLSKKAKKIHGAWGTSRHIFVDVFDLDLNLRTPNGMHFVDHLFLLLRGYGVQAIPVIGLDRAGDISYVEAIKNILFQDHRGVCIRLLLEDFELFQDTYVNIEELIERLNSGIESTHILMDLRSIFEEDLDEIADIATSFLARLPHISHFQTITLSSSGFPENLGLISPHSVGTISRAELDLRDELFFRKGDIPRFPAFGDYGICHPDLLDFDPRLHTPSAAIRYTTEREWLIVKAGSLKKYSYEQFRELSDILRKRPEYHGPYHCWGDNYIDECAECNVGNGNLTTWRMVGTNHHLTLVGGQIANSRVI